MSDFIDSAILEAGLAGHINENKPGLYACTITGTANPGFQWLRNLNTKAGYEAPSIGNVMYYYALRAQEVSQYDDILAWADDTSRDLNDPKTIPEFKQLVQDKTDLRLLLSEPIYRSMMTGLEISQAIGNAAGSVGGNSPGNEGGY